MNCPYCSYRKAAILALRESARMAFVGIVVYSLIFLTVVVVAIASGRTDVLGDSAKIIALAYSLWLLIRTPLVFGDRFYDTWRFRKSIVGRCPACEEEVRHAD